MLRTKWQIEEFQFVFHLTFAFEIIFGNYEHVSQYWIFIDFFGLFPRSFDPLSGWTLEVNHTKHTQNP